VIRGCLTAACDAASLATARNLNLGLTLTEQTAPATTNSPLYFMRILGETAAVAGAVGKASRREPNLMLVLDRSGSKAGTPCSDMITAAKTFVNMFVNGRDRLGLVTFNSSYYLAYAPSTSFRSAGTLLTDSIDAIGCSGGTNTSDAYMSAYNQLVTINQPLALNLIVFFTDGYPTALSATFPVKTVSDQCSIPKSTCVDDNGRDSNSGSWGTFSGKAWAIVAANSSTNATGYTLGLLARTETSSNGADVMASAAILNGCATASSRTYVRQALAYVPDTDLNGLSTAGYQSVSVYPGTNPNYSGKKRINTPINNQNMAMNLADNAATSARANSTLNVVTYTIGLGANGGLDDVLANDPLSNIYDSTKPDGLYVFAPNSSDLNSGSHGLRAKSSGWPSSRYEYGRRGTCPAAQTFAPRNVLV
jgi:hypothetical protein